MSLTQSTNFLEIKTCMRTIGSKHIKNQLGKISIPRNGFDMFDYLKNIKDLMLMADFGKCTQIRPELVKIRKWAYILENPVALIFTFIFNILTNLHHICLDLIMILEAQFYGDFTGIGIHSGYLVSDAFGPLPGGS